MEDGACDNSPESSEERLPVESQLVKRLREWQNDQRASVDTQSNFDRKLCDLLEWYICDCLGYGPDHLGGWWSDGVISLEITETGLHRFKLLGVTWIGCHGSAPFEIDVELFPSDDPHFAKTVFRIGMLDERRQPMIHKPGRPVFRILEQRPRHDRDWAMAVELTPLSDQEESQRLNASRNFDA